MRFDEFILGKVFETSSIKVSKEEIMSFADQFDPQYMHLDEEKAKQGRFKGIIASGLHTLSLSFRLCIDVGMFGEEVIAGTGINNLRFIKPVFPDDTLYAFIKVIDKKKTKNNAGIVTMLVTSFTNEGEKVLEFEMSALVSCD